MGQIVKIGIVFVGGASVTVSAPAWAAVAAVAVVTTGAVAIYKRPSTGQVSTI